MRRSENLGPDKKHSIFGSVVGGIDTLRKLERIETDAKDCPAEDIVVKEVVVFVNPFETDLKAYYEEKQSNEIKEVRVCGMLGGGVKAM
eukprot:746647-Hanusia_phi.AAC.2